MKGATSYEYQVGRLSIRFLRPRFWFWPYKQFGVWRLPSFIRFKWEAA